jgi:protocatechuate 3,4-dioxygenase beta subunit
VTDEPVSARVTALLDSSARTCRLFAEQDEGPYRRGEQPDRRDVTEDRSGSPLGLGVRLRTDAGAPIVGADVEIWHCDAGGRYSGYPPNDPAVAVDSSPQMAEYLPDESFLRGRQATDGAGTVEFHTLYPGWYPGRAVHIHAVVRTAERDFITQLYFPEDLTVEVFAHDPYRGHGPPNTTHATDGIFPTGGDPAVLDVSAEGDGHIGVICLVLPPDHATT